MLPTILSNPTAADCELEPLPTPPALILQPVLILEFVALVTAAAQAAQSLDRFVQLNDPAEWDVHALEQLRTALAPFYPDPPTQISNHCNVPSTPLQ